MPLPISITALCLSKIEGLVIRCMHFIIYIPKRSWRIVMHFWKFGLRVRAHPRTLFDLPLNFYWLIELFCYICDLVGVSELYESSMDIVKFNTRPLTSEETALVTRYFGDQLAVRRIRIDSWAFGGPKSHHFAYVSFYTINSWGPLQRETFVHELIHIRQYEQLGAVYIPRALRAQHSEHGYNYGGTSELLTATELGQGLNYFNLEQQGDILADHYRMQSGKKPRWSSNTSQSFEALKVLIDELKVG